MNGGSGGSALVTINSARDVLVLVVVVLAMTAAAALVHHFGGLGRSRDTMVAAGRALLQLAVVGVLITAVLGSWWLTAGFVTLMLLVAAWTSAGRVDPGHRSWWPLLPILVAVVPTCAILFATRLIPMNPIAVVPIVGIVIGNAMTATTLAGRRSLGALEDRHGEYEAALSIGLLRRDAVMLVAREEAALALVPGLDQTRTVGLVTLPGAFVGTLLGGASPLQAAAVQLIVLVALLLAQSSAVVTMLELVARGRVGRFGR